jgi:hypothetical protein
MSFPGPDDVSSGLTRKVPPATGRAGSGLVVSGRAGSVGAVVRADEGSGRAGSGRVVRASVPVVPAPAVSVRVVSAAVVSVPAVTGVVAPGAVAGAGRGATCAPRCWLF